MRICIILNPAAGSAGTVTEVEASLARMGEVLVRETHEAGDARRFAEEAVADGFERVIAAGGDGTVNEVLSGLAGDFNRITLGVLPLGTGNDFARALDMPLEDVSEAVKYLSEAAVRAVDVIRITCGQQRYFINAAGAGFTAKVGEKIDSHLKGSWGTLAYVLGAAKTLPELNPYRVRLDLDGEIVESEAYALLIANGCCVGGGIPVAPWARFDDGKADVILVPALNVARLAIVVPQILAGRHEGAEDLIIRRISRAGVTCEPLMPLNVDGEPIGECNAEFEVMAGALRMLVR